MQPMTLWRQLAMGSTNHRIFAAVLTTATFTGVAKLTSLVKELVVAWRFGTSDTLEAYLVAYLIPTLGVTVLASSINESLIPTYVRVREHEGLPAAQKLLSEVTLWCIALLSVVTVGVMLLAFIYLPLLASGFSDQKLRLTLYLTYLLAPTIVLGGISNIWGAVLNASERFALVAITPVITPVSVLVLILLFRSWGIFALAGGMVCGALLEVVLLGIALRLRGISLRPSWHGFGSHPRVVAGQFGHRLFAALLRSGSNVVDRAMAAMLAAGSVAALNYGNRVGLSLISIVSVTLGSAVVPYFSKMAAHKDLAGLRHSAKRYISLMILLVVPLTAALFYWSVPIIRILYQRGSFTAQDTYIVSRVQAFYILQLPLTVSNLILARLLAAFLAARIIMMAAFISFLLNIFLNVLFIRHLGVAGIALSTTCTVAMTFCFMLYHSRRILKQAHGENS
jgi:putative peptidoglycan lipid II flippase